MRRKREQFQIRTRSPEPAQLQSITQQNLAGKFKSVDFTSESSRANVVCEPVQFPYPNDKDALCRLLLPIHNIGYGNGIPSNEHHKNGYWWRRRGVWVAASVLLKRIRSALHTIYTVFSGC